MKLLSLFRHGKSSWKYNVLDQDRPLKTRGMLDAKVISNQLKMSNFRPNLMVSSPAKRALTTSQIFIKNLEFNDDDLIINDEIYDFEGKSTINFIKQLDKKYDNIILFGHNYAFTNIANTYGDIYIDNIPTSGCVTLQIDIENWNELKEGKTICKLFPRDFKL